MRPRSFGATRAHFDLFWYTPQLVVVIILREAENDKRTKICLPLLTTDLKLPYQIALVKIKSDASHPRQNQD